MEAQEQAAVRSRAGGSSLKFCNERYKAAALLATFSTIFVDGGGAAIEGEACSSSVI